MEQSVVQLRLIHDNAPPIHDTGEPYLFGLQTTKQDILPGQPMSDGRVAFEFELTVKSVPKSDRPAFGGRCASGSVDDRFVYLSWKAIGRDGFINRIKARLGSITWDQIREAQRAGRPLQADLSGRKPHDASALVWSLTGGASFDNLRAVRPLPSA